MVNLQLPNPKKILAIGDCILDVYTMGEVSRVSPEAPISVLLETTKEMKLGGVCNVAKNLKSLGMHVTLAGRIGKDEEGRQVQALLREEEIIDELLVIDESICTITKNRFIASNQQMLRVDREETHSLSAALENAFLQKVLTQISAFDAIVFSDYAKGFLTNHLLQTIIDRANELGIPTIVDPKGKDFSKYRGCAVIKPNEKEAYLATPFSKKKPLDVVAEFIRKEYDLASLFITRASKGISIYSDEMKKDFPTQVHDVIDVTGAGDTVLAILAACIANTIDLSVAAELANVGASIAIEHLGCASITMDDIHRRLLLKDGSNKVFTSKNVDLLTKLLKDKSYTLFPVHSSHFSLDLFQEMKRKKQKEDLLVCSVQEEGEIVDLLQSIDFVDFVVVGSDVNKLEKEMLVC